MSAPHESAVRRSLLLHQAVMERIARDPTLVERTRERVAEWKRNKSVAGYYVDAWARVLALPIAELTARVLDPSDAGADLRQVSPFAGVLSARERWQILRGASVRAPR